MFAKCYVTVFSLIFLIQLTLARQRTPKLLEADEEVLDDDVETPVTRPPAPQSSTKSLRNSKQIDVNFYYRIYNDYLDTSKVLEIQPAGNSYALQMSPISRKYSQQFYFVRLSNGFFAIRNRKLGDEFSLDVINDSSKSRVAMFPSGDYSGQMWRFVPSMNQTYRLFNFFTGEDKSLDIFSDTQIAHLSDASAMFGGQFWKLEKLGPVENF